MTKEQFIDLLRHPAKAKEVSEESFASLVAQFPYCQPLRVLQLRNLLDNNSVRYDNELKLTAAHIPDRHRLFELMHQPEASWFDAPAATDLLRTEIERHEEYEVPAGAVVFDDATDLLNGHAYTVGEEEEEEKEQKISIEERQQLTHVTSDHDVEIKEQVAAEYSHVSNEELTKSEEEQDEDELSLQDIINERLRELNIVPAVEEEIVLPAVFVPESEEEGEKADELTAGLSENNIQQYEEELSADLTSDEADDELSEKNSVDTDDVNEEQHFQDTRMHVVYPSYETEPVVSDEDEKEEEVVVVEEEQSSEIYSDNTETDDLTEATDIDHATDEEDSEAKQFESEIVNEIIVIEDVSAVENHKLAAVTDNDESSLTNDDSEEQVEEYSTEEAEEVTIHPMDDVAAGNAEDELEKLLQQGIEETKAANAGYFAVHGIPPALENKTEQDTAQTEEPKQPAVKPAAEYKSTSAPQQKKSSSENHSFSEWLRLSRKNAATFESVKPPVVHTTPEPLAEITPYASQSNPADENESKPAKPIPVNDSTPEKGEELIQKFIREEPRILPSRSAFYSPVNMAKKSVQESDEVVSETLARIYAQQGNFQKAIQLYHTLSLKFPEKSSYFAALIDDLNKKYNS